ncbi:MAG: hypothetical protein K2L18_05305, partial [Acetatifactor sp.]|nr:hypothetical protein [Acetatifactor sp.]
SLVMAIGLIPFKTMTIARADEFALRQTSELCLNFFQLETKPLVFSFYALVDRNRYPSFFELSRLIKQDKQFCGNVRSRM